MTVVKAYADDTQLLVMGNNQQVKTKLEKTIKQAQEWFRQNSLQINPTKTEIMILGGRNDGDRLKVEVHEGNRTINIQTVPHLKVLGVTLDEEMSWKKQVKQVKKKASNSIRHLARTGKILPTRTKRLLYDALVAPHFSYADIVWDGCLREQEIELQRLHNFAVKTIAGPNCGHTAEAMHGLGMIPLKEKRRVHHAVMAHKLINGKGPRELCSRFKNIRESEQDKSKLANRLRSKSRMDIQPEQHRTSRYEKATLYRVAKAWNQTDPKTRKIETTSNFKVMTQREFTRSYWQA